MVKIYGWTNQKEIKGRRIQIINKIKAIYKISDIKIDRRVIGFVRLWQCLYSVQTNTLFSLEEQVWWYKYIYHKTWIEICKYSITKLGDILLLKGLKSSYKHDPQQAMNKIKSHFYVFKQKDL
jgi:hypothetical protein